MTILGVGGEPVTAAAELTQVAGPPANIDLSVTAGGAGAAASRPAATVPFEAVATVTDRFGNLVPGADVRIVTDGEQSVGPVAEVAAGRYAASIQALTGSGQFHVTASVADVLAVEVVDVGAGPELPPEDGGPGDDAPGDDAPGDESPGGDEGSDDDGPDAGAPDEVPDNEAPDDDAPGDEAPDDDAPDDDGRDEEAPGDDGPDDEVPGDEAPDEEAPGDKSPDGDDDLADTGGSIGQQGALAGSLLLAGLTLVAVAGSTRRRATGQDSR